MDSTNNSPDQRPKAAYDPGWNDPPQFSYNAQQSTPGRPRNFLNKRVAFPLSNTTSSVAPTGPTSLPPMPVAPLIPSMPPMLPTQQISNITCPEETDINENALREVKEILIQFLESSSELGPKANDIKRRLSVMEDMWLSGKLNTRIHTQMKELASALRDDIPSKADDIHRELMVDHVTSVGTWMPGVKQLIHHCIARSELLAIDKEQCQDAEN